MASNRILTSSLPQRIDYEVLWESPGGLKTYVDESIPKKGKQHGHALSTDLELVVGDITADSEVNKPETGQAEAAAEMNQVEIGMTFSSFRDADVDGAEEAASSGEDDQAKENQAEDDEETGELDITISNSFQLIYVVESGSSADEVDQDKVDQETGTQQ